MTKQEAREMLIRMTREHLGAIHHNGRWWFRCDAREAARSSVKES